MIGLDLEELAAKIRRRNLQGSSASTIGKRKAAVDDALDERESKRSK